MSSLISSEAEGVGGSATGTNTNLAMTPIFSWVRSFIITDELTTEASKEVCPYRR